MSPERPVGAEVVLLALGGVLLRDAVPPVLVHGVQVQLDGDSEFILAEFEFRRLKKLIICSKVVPGLMRG